MKEYNGASDYTEVKVDTTQLNNFSTEQSIGSLLTYSTSEKVYELREDLYEEIKQIISEKLTEKQKKVIYKYFLEGMTQEKIADELAVHQTCVHKTLFGNIDYSRDKRYGGAIRSIQKQCAKNSKVQKILIEMDNIRGK